MRLVDLQKLGYTGETYSLPLTHNTPTTIPTGIVLNKIPSSVLVAVAFGPGESMVGYGYTLSGNNEPIVTPQFSGTTGTRNARVIILYRE